MSKQMSDSDPMSAVSMMQVQLVCALREREKICTIEVESSASIEMAVRQSQILDDFPELQGITLSYAIFGKRALESQILQTGDRIEILRPLTVDPREARRRRAALRKKTPK